MFETSLNDSPRERILRSARALFDEKGFHSTSVAELASRARVSIGQMYRFFPGKDDLVLAIVDARISASIEEIEVIFHAAARGECSAFEAIKAIARASISREEGGLIFEILAETYRNPRVAEKLSRFIAPYQDGIKRIASLMRPQAEPGEIDAYSEIMMACFFGLGHRTLIRPTIDVDAVSHATACILVQALKGMESCGRIQPDSSAKM